MSEALIEQLKKRSLLHLWIQLETREHRDTEPPAAEASAWGHFVLTKVQLSDAELEGQMLAMSAHHMEKTARQKMQEADEAWKKWKLSLPDQDEQRRPFQGPDQEDPMDIAAAYLVKVGVKRTILSRALIEPPYEKARSFLGPYEDILFEAAVNHSGGHPDPKAFSGISLT